MMGFPSSSVVGLFVFLSIAYLQVQSAPVRTPDFSTCQISRFPYPLPGTGSNPDSFNCCPPVFNGTVKEFESPVKKGDPIRIRRALQCADEEYLAKLEKGYELMRALPKDDPRSLHQQSIMHCAYCGGGFLNPGTNNSIDIHFTWLFFPWHRAFLYFHERILQSLLDDPTFSLPFWNYDNQLSAFEGPDVALPSTDPSYCFKSGNKFPTAYTKNESSLSVRRLFLYPGDSSNAVVDMGLYVLKPPNQFASRSRSYQVASNLNLLHRALVKTSKKPEIFFGAPARATDPQSKPNFDRGLLYGGSVEMGPHSSAHIWVGALEEPVPVKPGLWNAASDPVFYANHGNVDRFWNVWKSLGGGREDLREPDFLNAEFMFYDENAQVVRIKVQDLLKSENLGYKYQSVPNAWISQDDAPVCSETPVSELEAIMKMPHNVHAGNISLDVNVTFQAVVDRSHKSLHKGRKDEILAISGIKIGKNLPVQFAVYINIPNATSDTPWICTEFAGRFAYMPIIGGSERDISAKKFSYKVSIGEALTALNHQHLPSVVVSVVLLPGADSATVPPVFVQTISIEY